MTIPVSDLAELAGLYRDLHAHPELAFAEHRTAGLAAARLGYQVTEGVGRTGVVGVLRNGDGPAVLLRADMDALPVREQTGLPYACTTFGADPHGRERTFDEPVRAKTLAAIERIVRGEAATAGAPAGPEITTTSSTPAVVNDPAACGRLTEAFDEGIGPGLVLDPGPVSGSENVGLLATAAAAPCVYWLLGGADPALFANVTSIEEARAIVSGLPSNHSPWFAPVIEPTLRTGVTALTCAARAWLAPS